ncbi:MAG: hypothetical protein GY719_37700 [bacterium]|nr:hypothetical protein [bacterium]
MRFGTIEIDWELINSLETDRLVLFVGAGVSVDPPSGLPLFDVLATRIADNSLERQDNEPIERFLGRVELDGKVKVHRRAAHILARSNSRPNKLHRLIVEFFNNPQRVRIVTTNFDLHLETALKDTFEDSAENCEIFTAPALPIGSDFRGIAYLHGRLRPDPSRMVLTDRDFGRAYLTEGWARRFLTELFQSYDVLFIGYSHSDTILNYLARGLPPETQRLRATIVEAGDADRWAFLGIKPLEYPRGEHHEIQVALAQWMRLGSLSAQDHEAEVREIVARPRELLTPHENDQLLWIAHHENYRHFLFNQVNGPEWLDWADNNDLLAPLFAPASKDRETVNWFAESPLTDRGDAAITVLHKHTQEKCTYLAWHTIAHRVWVSVKKREGELTEDEYRRLVQWVAILRLHAEPGWTWDMLDYLVESLNPSAGELILELFDALTEPHLVTADRYLHLQDKPTPWNSELFYRMPKNSRGLRRAWKNAILPNLNQFAGPILALVRIQFERSYRLLHAVGQATSDFDPQSYHRTTIEESDQARYMKGAIDFLVEAGRDALAWTVVEQPRDGRAVIESWLRSDATLLQRLALYGARLHPSLSATQKGQYLLGDGRINNHQLHHETFLLVQDLYPNLKQPWRRRLLKSKRQLLAAEYADKTADDQERAHKRETYNWFTFLSWLNGADPECKLVEAELEEVRRQHPKFVVEERPDLTHYIGEGGYRTPAEPVSTNEMLDLTPEGTLARYQLLVEDDRHGIRDLPGGFCRVFEKAVKQDFAWSLRQGEYLLSQDEDRGGRDLQHSLIRGWQESDLEAADWTTVLDLVRAGMPSDPAQRDVVELLKRRFESEVSGLDCNTIQQTVRLALELHRNLSAVDAGVLSPTDSLQLAVSHPSGQLALFGVRALSRALKLDCSSPEDFPELWVLFDAFVDDARAGRAHGLVVLASQLHFMLYANQAWATTQLLPHFDWEKDSEMAASLWVGFLYWGKLSPLTVEGVLPLFPQLFLHLDELPDRIRERASEYVAIIAFRATDTPVREEWFKEYLRRTTGDDRQHFAWQMQQILSELWDALDKEGVETGDALWARLLSGYLDARLTAGMIGEGEWSAVASWCPYLHEAVPDFVDRFVQGPAPYDAHMDVFHRLLDAAHLYEHPNAIGRFTSHLLSGQRREECWILDDVRKIVENLRNAGASRGLVDEIVNKALELGASSSSFRTGASS